MGGYGSTRWGWHSKKKTAEESRRIAIKDLRTAIQAVSAGQCVYWGSYSWTCGGQPSGNISYQVENQGGGLAMRLLYTVTDQQTGENTDYDYRVWMHNTPALGGAVRWWFNCPGCGRRCGTLYLPPGALRFACRCCYDLTYASCQDARKPGPLDRLLAGALQTDYLDLTPADAMRFMRCELQNKPLPSGIMAKLKERAIRQVLEELANRPQPYANYLTAAELCERSGLTLDDLAGLEAARLLLPDRPSGKYRPKLASWAGKLAYLLWAGWAIPEIRAWAKGRWSTPNLRAWPPAQEEWQAS